MADQQMKISMISTCKSRLEYLKQVIPSWIAFEPFEIIVVDVDCPDGTRDWLAQNYPSVKVIRHNREGFNKPEASNIGARAASGDCLFFVDADINLGHGFHQWIRENWPRTGFLVRARNNAYDGIHEQGTVLCRRADFFMIGGYDEVMEGYGGEDHDFFYRLTRAGVGRYGAPHAFISSLDHDDEERSRHYRVKDKNVHIVVSRMYRAAKEFLLANQPGVHELPMRTRLDVWRACQNGLGDEYENMPEKGSVKIKFDQQKWLPEPYFLACEMNLQLNVRKRT
jgi:glycosyltransferase involved in cell wall biosynthesis